jgi:hypothetical protein
MYSICSVSIILFNSCISQEKKTAFRIAQILCFWTLSIVLSLSKNTVLFTPVYISKHNVSDAGLCLRLYAKLTQLGPIDKLIPISRLSRNTTFVLMYHRHKLASWTLTIWTITDIYSRGLMFVVQVSIMESAFCYVLHAQLKCPIHKSSPSYGWNFASVLYIQKVAQYTRGRKLVTLLQGDWGHAMVWIQLTF